MNCFEKSLQVDLDLHTKRIQQSVLEVFPKIESLISHVLHNHDETLQLIRGVSHKQQIEQVAIRKTFDELYRDMECLESSIQYLQKSLDNSFSSQIRAFTKRAYHEIRDFFEYDFAVVAPWFSCAGLVVGLSWLALSSEAGPDL